MNKPAPARYRTTNWFSFNEALRKRGSLLISLDKEMTWLAPYDDRPRSPCGFLGCGDPIPPVDRSSVQAATPVVDSTGIKFLGFGEWQAHKHGVQGRRQWRKVYFAKDAARSDIRVA